MSTDARQVRSLAQMLRAGLPVEVDGLDLSPVAQTQLARLLEFTKQVGGPIAPTLDRFASVLLRREQLAEELEIAAAGPKASARLVMSLPLLVLLGAAISGIPVVSVFRSSSLVWISLILGLSMFWLGSKWSKKILNSAQASTIDPGFPFELLAVGVAAGLPLVTACELAECPPETVSFIGDGIASAGLLTERAGELREEQANQDRKKIQNASVKILWPLGITVLPAFVLVAIVPIGLALVAV